MGVGASTTVAEQKSQQVLKALQTFESSCKAAPVKQTMSGTHINIQNSQAGNITLEQKATVSMDCVITQSANWFAQQLQNNKNSTQAKNASQFLGINIDTAVSKTQSDLSQEIKQKILNKCGAGHISQLQTNISVDIQGSQINNFTLSQVADSKTQCALSTIGTAHAKMTGEQTQDTVTGGNTMQMLIMAVIAIAVIGIVGVVVYKVSQSDAAKQAIQVVAQNPELLA